MHFTLWPNLTATTGGHAEITWRSFVEFVAAPVVAADKNALEGWSPARFAGNARLKANAEAVSAVALDDDVTGLPLERVCAIWSRFAGVIHTTHSYTDAAPKYRIVLRCSRDMTADEHARVWFFVHAGAGAAGQTVDPSTKDPSRLWFVPAHRDGAPYAWAELTGAPLDVDAILAETPADPPATASAPHAIAPATDRRNAMAAALRAAWPPKGRHAAQLALAGALRGEGWSPEDAVDFLEAVAGDRAKREATVRHTWAKAPGEPLTGWTRLKAHVDPLVVDAARGALARDAEWTERTTRRLAETAAANAPTVPPESNDLGITWGKWDEPVVIPPYLLQGLIPAGKVCTFFAEGGSVKTWAALALAISVATGRPWLGEYVVQKGRALILDFEDGREEFKRRKRFITHDDTDIPDLGYKYGSCDLLKQSTWDKLAELGLLLLVVDALGTAMPADASENDTQFAAAVKLAGKFTERTDCTVLFVHHANKAGGMRGTSAIRDQSDVAFKFEPVSETDDVKRMRMICDKPGPQKKPPPVNIELSDTGLHAFRDEAQQVGRNAETSGDVQEAIKLTLANGPIETKKKIRMAVGKGQKKVDDELDALVARREVIFIAGVGYSLDGPKQRTERVVRNVQASDRWTSAAKLAKASYVDTRVVDGLIRDGVICRRVGNDDAHGFMVRTS